MRTRMSMRADEHESHIAELPAITRYMVFGNRAGMTGIGYWITEIIFYKEFWPEDYH